MKQSSHQLIRRLAAFIALSAALTGTAQRATDSEPSAEFLKDCQVLTSDPHRLSGTPEFRRAADYIEKRLNEIGGAQVLVQEFNFARVQSNRCVLEILAPDRGQLQGRETQEAATKVVRRLPLLPMRPNGIIPPVTPKAGITGVPMYVGNGSLEAYGTTSPLGRIVIMDYNSGSSWLTAIRMGAKAVIFVANGTAEAWNPHHTWNNANIPRFYYEGPKADLIDAPALTIHSEAVWIPAVGRNVFAYFPGTDATFRKDQEEVVIISVNLDSFGDVPQRSPGGRGAANAAALLKIARDFAAKPPRRHLLLAFFDGEAWGHAGATAFYRGVMKDASGDDRHEANSAEIEFGAELENLVNQDQPLSQTGTKKSSALRPLEVRIRATAENHVATINAKKQSLNIARAAILNDNKNANTADIDANLAALTEEKTRWNEIRRQLSKDKDFSDEKLRLTLKAALLEVRADVAVRRTELQLEKKFLTDEKALETLLGDRLITLHATLMLGDRALTWGLVANGDSRLCNFNDKPGAYLDVQDVFVQAYDELLKNTAGLPSHFMRESADGTIAYTRFLSALPQMTTSGEIAGVVGIYNLALATIHETMPQEGTPDDTLAYLDLAVIETQAEEISRLMGLVVDDPGLSLNQSLPTKYSYVAPRFSGGRPTGPVVSGRSRTSSMRGIGLPGAVIQLNIGAEDSARNIARFTEPRSFPYHSRKFYGYNDFHITMTNHNGSYTFGPISGNLKGGNPFAVKFDSRGEVVVASNFSSKLTLGTRINAFFARGAYAVIPPNIKFKPGVRVPLNGDTRAALGTDDSYHILLDGVLVWYGEDKVDRFQLFDAESMVILNSGDDTLDNEAVAALTMQAATGIGFSFPSGQPGYNASAQSAADLWRLDEVRLSLLRSRGITNRSVEELHGRAAELIHESATATTIKRREAVAAAAFMSQKSLYKNVLGMLNDLVHAVLILLIITVPFSFALERLLIGATSVYRQIGWFASFFTATFLLLYFSHPAFSVSNTPIVIFLGFAILILSVMVIIIILRRFEAEIRALQGQAATVHAADISRVSTIVAAMNMGISTMRRRPLRTALTAVTVLLLTFTILCFASFGTETGIVKFLVAPATPYSGVFIHHVDWRRINPEMVETAEGLWQGRGDVCIRSWESSGQILVREDGKRPTPIKAVVGLDDTELKHRPDLRRLLGHDGAVGDRVWMTKAVAKRLAVVPGDTVLLAGTALEVGQFVDTVALSVFTEMDGKPLTPVDFLAMAALKTNMGLQENVASAPEIPDMSWSLVPSDAVIFTSIRHVRRMQGQIHAISIYTADPDEAGLIAEEAVRILQIPVAATRPDGVYRHVLGTVLQASGVKDLFFPILLGALVVFGTMLGSVADREKEIYTFSALGLAPQHVAGLFFAEAMVYSVIGGLGGYLIAQGSVKILQVMAGYGLVQVPAINYSSTNAIVTLLIVMCTVMISAIYPAIKASRSANPGVMRNWVLPPPEGDRFDLVFPFTVSEYDLTGVVSFLLEHFENHRDAGLGSFISRDTKLVRLPDNQIGLEAELSLAPFDLGVSESFLLRSKPSEIEGIDEISIIIDRRSGQPKDWKRLNKVLFNDLRKQFLIWRSLTQETMERYRENTLALLGADDVTARDG